MFDLPKSRYKSIPEIFESYGLSDWTSPEVLDQLRGEIGIFLLNKKYSLEELQKHLKINLEGNSKRQLFKLKPYNLISALWICGIYPSSIEDLQNKEEYATKDFIYIFSNKSGKLRKKQHGKK